MLLIRHLEVADGSTDFIRINVIIDQNDHDDLNNFKTILFKLNNGITISRFAEILKNEAKFIIANPNVTALSSYLMGYVCSHKGFKFLLSVEEDNKNKNAIIITVEKEKLKMARENSKCLEEVIAKIFKGE